MSTLRWYFDFISPYAYLGWPQVLALVDRRALTLEPIPVLFAGLLDRYGQKGPAEIEPKRLYTFKHVVRIAHERGVPLRPPPAHPFNPLLALRLASLPSLGARQREVVDRLFSRTWGEGTGITDPVALAQELDALDLPGAELVEEAATAAAKARLRTQTEQAVDRGVFGVPSIEVVETGEIFWGQDALPHVERHLDGDDPVSDALLERWRDLPAGAVRPGSKR